MYTHIYNRQNIGNASPFLPVLSQLTTLHNLIIQYAWRDNCEEGKYSRVYIEPTQPPSRPMYSKDRGGGGIKALSIPVS